MAPLDSGILVPFFVCVMLGLLVKGFFSYGNRQSKIHLIEKLLDKGTPLTPELLESINNISASSTTKRTPISNAVYLILLGLGLAVFFWAMSSSGAPVWLAAIGVFPVVLGLSRLVGIFFDHRADK